MRLLMCLVVLGFVLASWEAGAAPLHTTSLRTTSRHADASAHTRGKAKRGLGLRARCRLLRQKLRCSAAGRFTARSCKVAKRRFRRVCRAVKHTNVGRGMRYLSWQVRGHMTLLADRIELKLNPKFAGLFHRMRAFNPATLGGFAFRKFRQDPLFMAGYGSWSTGFSNLQMPIMIAAGFNPVLTLGVRMLTGTPVDLGVLWWRQHTLRKRKNPGLTPMGTLRELTGEYRTFSNRRRKRARRFMRWNAHRKAGQQRPAPPLRENPLRALAAPLR